MSDEQWVVIKIKIEDQDDYESLFDMLEDGGFTAQEVKVAGGSSVG